MSKFSDGGDSAAETRVSALVFVIYNHKTLATDAVRTLLYIIKGIVRPCSDAAPIHEQIGHTHSWSVALRWLSSSKLANISASNWKYANWIPYGILWTSRENFEVPQNTSKCEALTIEKTTDWVKVILAQGPLGVFTMMVAPKGQQISRVHYKYVPSSEVSGIHTNTKSRNRFPSISC